MLNPAARSAAKAVIRAAGDRPSSRNRFPLALASDFCTKASQRQSDTCRDPSTLPLSDVSPPALFGRLDDQTWGWLHLEARAQCPFLADYLPSLPPDALQSGITATSGSVALAHGFEIYELFKRLLREHGHSLEPSEAVLDFGCGWGRVMRYFIRDVEPGNLWGVDVSGTAIEACRETNRWGRFEQIAPLPPCRFGDGTFDLVYAYSVFSHLSEESHLAWLEEFERLLKPGGVFLASTLSRSFIEGCGELARQNTESLSNWMKDAVESFPSSDESLAAYDRGEYCFGAISGADEHFGNTCIPERYVRQRWEQHFVVRDYLLKPGVAQAIIVCSRR
jgi:SAM-dependent methyltransferase